MPVSAVNKLTNAAANKEKVTTKNSDKTFNMLLSKKVENSHLSNYQIYRAKRTMAKLNAKSAVAKRNAQLKQVAIFKKGNVLSDSGNSAKAIDQKLKNTPLRGLGKSFKKAEQKSGVNAYALTAIALHESGFGKSKIAKQKYNLFGFQAYDNSPYQSAKTFDSYEQGIFHVADYLRKNYLSVDGKYYNGTTLSAIGKNYASDPQWAQKVEAIMKALMKG